jgi:DNA-binding PadR family transcriptional regulator
VLGLLAEAPAHGFALAKSLAADGDLGTIWTLSRPLVYRVLTVLEQPGLIRAAATESGPGPARTIMTVTPVGRRVLEHWLAEPVEHVRDARSLLMLKLAFINRSGGDPRALLEGQRQLLTRRAESHEAAPADQTDWQRTVELWRYESVQAALRFTEQMLAGGAPSARSASGEEARRP